MTKDEALKLALEALEVATTPLAKDRQEVLRAQAAIREALAEQPAQCTNSDTWNCKYCRKNKSCDALKDPRNFVGEPAQPERKPVAYGMWDTMLGKDHRMMMVRLDKGQDGCTIPLYTSPPQRKPLTDEEIKKIWGSYFSRGIDFARAIEAAHGIKE